MATLNLTAELERLIADIVRQVEEFSHIDPGRLLICTASTRGGGVHGTYAKIHPLRFAGGVQSTRMRRGRRTVTCTMPTVTHHGREVLYVIYFLVPRFLDLPLREKLITVFHELFHVSPAFDGDIRRFPGKNYAHGSSTKRYNAYMAKLADAWLEAADESLTRFLDGTMEEMRCRYRAIVGRRFPAPKIAISD
ncbi:MAG TPA: putative metallopeptidase [Geobacteraceae bacterium]